jgi:hypothetical protein
MSLTERDLFYLAMAEKLQTLKTQFEESVQSQVVQLLNLIEESQTVMPDPLHAVSIISYLDQLEAFLAEVITPLASRQGHLRIGYRQSLIHGGE